MRIIVVQWHVQRDMHHHSQQHNTHSVPFQTKCADESSENNWNRVEKVDEVLPVRLKIPVGPDESFRCLTDERFPCVEIDDRQIG